MTGGNMYYLYSAPYESVIPELTRPSGEHFPERKIMEPARAIFKSHDFSRFYRGTFSGLQGKYQGMKLYTCKRLSTILKLRQSTFDYCKEWFDVYDENGKVEIPRER